ncbi:MAG: GNAT family N-acetyltransferase [Thermoplasmata archaeon]|nr:GNAT family N-acetyltransferase [Candidatus Sysuiplasma acidicola]MBX8646271.1 GNAT family N-acetyltransferase [Candidatus Sysuiplasma acidicola]
MLPSVDQLWAKFIAGSKWCCRRIYVSDQALQADRDLEDVWHLHNEALLSTSAHLGNGPWDEDLRNIEKTYLETGGEFLVGDVGNVIVAMGALKRISENTAEIKRMRVRPALQGRCFGREMPMKLESVASQRGFHRILLDTSVLQTAAITMYRKLGYKEIGRGKMRDLDILYFEKYL